MTESLENAYTDRRELHMGLLRLPSTALFRDFCITLAKTLQHDYVQVGDEARLALGRFVLVSRVVVTFSSSFDSREKSVLQHAALTTLISTRCVNAANTAHDVRTYAYTRACAYCMQVHLANGKHILARRVVLAVGAAGELLRPPAFDAICSNEVPRNVIHTSEVNVQQEFTATNMTHEPADCSRCPSCHTAPSPRILPLCL